MCEFCKRFDFSTAKTEVDKHGARLLTGICNTKFSENEQFNFCPVCGRRLKDNVVDMKWISIKEKLPPLNQDVLVYYCGKKDWNKDLDGMAISDRYIFRITSSSEGWETWRNPFEYFGSNYEITHWMPLPEPPKEV